MSYRRLEITKCGGPEVLRIVEETSLPEPAKDEVRVKVLATGAAFTDIMIREGMYPEIKQKPPFTIGYDMVGVVDKIGEGVEKFKSGQRVADLMVIGACSEYVCVSADRLTLVPDELDAGEAVSLVLSYVTAYQMLNRIAEVKSGQRVLIHGAGGAVGTAMIQLSVLKDLEIYGTASKSKHELVSSLGAVPIDYQNEDYSDRLRSLANKGIDAVFDPIGGDNLKRSFSVLGHSGKLVSYGFYDSVLGKGGNIPLDFLRLKLWNIFPNHRSTSFYSIGATRKNHPDWFSEDLTTLFGLLKDGRISPVIGLRVPMNKATEAYELIEKANVNGKVIIEVA
ncbi:medium chain dehydrogenase/reductase family protein [Flexistipes sp.]|uniref:medium chain dehydrogenase/reductase family protein n=1 Tax=Flexistipes sp. TaxID=3088135 RepID=UPI002E1C1E39|nr:medium chain dehydrogenase/reductase family protein [Flexistipes sp.]